VNQQIFDIGTEKIEAKRPGDGHFTAALPHFDIASALSRMTYRERVSAYEHGIYTHQELFAVAAREPERMPTLNGEFEWIACFSADLE
jgi:hypothetical protein